MRKLAIMAALASTALATPAVARDNSWYAGIEGGVMLVEDGDFDFTSDDGFVVTEVRRGGTSRAGSGFRLIFCTARDRF